MELTRSWKRTLKNNDFYCGMLTLIGVKADGSIIEKGGIAMPKQDPIEDIRVDIESKFNMAVADMAADLTFQIQSAYETVIQSFYDDYTPRWYQRTYSTYEASDHADDPFKYTPISGGAEAGILVDPSFITGKPYRADTAWVFDRTFGKGIHGYFKWEMKQWGQSRWKATNLKYVMSKKKKEHFKKFLLSSMKNSPHLYKGLKQQRFIFTSAYNLNMKGQDAYYWDSIGSSEKKVVEITSNSLGSFLSHTTPQKMMDRTFKQLTTRRRLDAMFNDILTSYFSK